MNETTALHSYRKVESATDKKAIIRNNILPFYANPARAGQQPQDEPDGITACYERLSQEDKNEGESNSIANQKRILERYCKEHGYTPFRHYDEDDGYSGTTFNRPGFQRMLADIKAGKIARVIVKDMSRFGRDYLQVGMFTDILFPDFGVHFIAVNDGVDSTRGDNEFTAIRNVFNEMYARDTSKKLKATWQTKGKSGEHLCTRPPYGYRKDPQNKKKWLVDEEAAAVVQQIFALCVEGMGPSQIANRLKDQKILCPSAYFQSKGVKVPVKPPKDPCRWVNEAVSRILERLEYIGYTVNFKTVKPSYKQKKIVANDPEKWEIFEGTQEPIIEFETFMIVQNIRRGRRRITRSGEPGILSGLVYCGTCGGKMYQQRPNAKNKQGRFVCSTYSEDTSECTTHSIRNVVLEEIVLRHLREAIAYVGRFEDDFVREASDNAMREQTRETAKKRETLEKSEKRIAELDNVFKHLYEDNINGKLTDERFVKLSREYEAEQDELKAICEIIRKDLKVQEQKTRNVKSFIAATKKYTDLQALDAAVLREFIERIEIFEIDGQSRERRVHIVYNFIGAFDFGKPNQDEQSKPTAAHVA